VPESLSLTVEFKLATLNEGAPTIYQASLALRFCFVSSPYFISTATPGIIDFDPLNPPAVS